MNNQHQQPLVVTDGASNRTVALQQPDVVLTNPPRAGMHADCVSAVARLAARRVIYISCNPSTQARDVGELCSTGLYQVTSITPVDMFPHTPHIEVVCVLDRLLP